MFLEHTYKVFKSVIPPHVCEEIIKLGLSSGVKTGVTADKDSNDLSKEDLLNLQKIRHSNISWVHGEWIYKWVRPCVQETLKEWKYDINYIDNFQFTIYKENQFYGWHTDYFPNKNPKARDRKISLSISLSDPKDYKGGELEFIVDEVPEKRRSIVCKELAPRGSIAIFPSFVVHKVNPVTKGTRYSLVIWHEGPKWK
tara:strand:- start:204 stop:797 length:594 start_codon:yes stop_codon:yes gene_type:complete